MTVTWDYEIRNPVREATAMKQQVLYTVSIISTALYVQSPTPQTPRCRRHADFKNRSATVVKWLLGKPTCAVKVSHVTKTERFNRVHRFRHRRNCGSEWKFQNQQPPTRGRIKRYFFYNSRLTRRVFFFTEHSCTVWDIKNERNLGMRLQKTPFSVFWTML